MDAYGSDALRFTLARGANPGTDVPIGEEWVAGLAELLQQAVERHPLRADQRRDRRHRGAAGASSSPPADRWMLSRLHATVAEVDALYEDYEFAKATEALYHLVWDEFCDWYVELAKAPLARGGAEADGDPRGARAHPRRPARLLHPVIPFVTETAVDHADRRRVRRDRALAAVARRRAGRRGRRGADRRGAGPGHRDPPLPLRPGRAPSKKVAARIVADGTVAGLAEHADQMRRSPG